MHYRMTSDSTSRRRLFVDDSQPVLQSAKEYGVSMLVTVTRPDTTRPLKHGSEFRGVETVVDML